MVEVVGERLWPFRHGAPRVLKQIAIRKQNPRVVFEGRVEDVGGYRDDVRDPDNISKRLAQTEGARIAKQQLSLSRSSTRSAKIPTPASRYLVRRALSPVVALLAHRDVVSIATGFGFLGYLICRDSGPYLWRRLHFEAQRR
ncbi:hypothetical protein RGR602_CH03126 [Rhizobium gallicum bv. gallicum R602sp]|uniref:Uncharacterized protein n=1 Tax=Rhizobium gallicum bv. gallicum R602sp TaxID=1041138 RepID=A0A0B4X7B4_9HYPH|nr:hypothetical protein RGR602_CH03126 [Rhizobium gallicum bv. gallicum R602sp]